MRPAPTVILLALLAALPAVAEEPAAPAVPATRGVAGGVGPEVGGFQLGMTVGEVRRAAAGRLGMSPEQFEAAVADGTIRENVYKESINRMPPGGALTTVCFNQHQAKVPEEERWAPCRSVSPGPLWRPTINPIQVLWRIDLHTETKGTRTVPRAGGATEELEITETRTSAVAWFAGLPGSERVVAIRREQTFDRDERRPTLQATVEVMVEKFGTPLWCDRLQALAGAKEWQLEQVFKQALGQVGCYWRPKGPQASRLPTTTHPLLALALCRDAMGLGDFTGLLTRGNLDRTLRVPIAARPSGQVSPETFVQWITAARERKGVQEVQRLDLCGDALLWAPGVVDDPRAAAAMLAKVEVQAGWFRGALDAQDQVRRRMAELEVEAKARLEAEKRKAVKANKNTPDL
jgi:hypothetical protein